MMRGQDRRCCASTVTVIVEGEVYAHVARSLIFDGRSLTLVDVAPSTLWSSPGPTPGLGYLPTGAFLDVWAERATTPGPAPPRMRGVLSLLNPDAPLAGRSVLVLSNLRVSAQGLTYDAEVVEGLVPAESGACVLFLTWETAPMPDDGTGQAHHERPVA
jgi:hypothetical protein